MNVLSLFDGISCGRIALERADIPVTRYFASEIDKHAIKVSKHNWPDIIQLSDVQKIKYKNGTQGLGIVNDEYYYSPYKIDLLIAGSPCQGFSNAGARLNFEDPRSKLFFEFVRILKEIRIHNPQVKFLLENVKMKKEWRNTISGILGVEPILINSALVSAQNRERYYWTNIEGIQQPKDKKIYLIDILQESVDDKYYHTEAAINYMNRTSVKGRVKWYFGYHSDTSKQK